MGEQDPWLHGARQSLRDNLPLEPCGLDMDKGGLHHPFLGDESQIQKERPAL